MKTRLVIGTVVSLAAVHPGLANEIYKTTNSDGTVSYSNVAPDSAGGSEVIEAIPEPSAEDQQAAQQRLREIQASLERRRIERAEADEESAEESNDESTSEENDDNTDNPTSPINNGFIGVAPFI